MGAHTHVIRGVSSGKGVSNGTGDPGPGQTNVYEADGDICLIYSWTDGSGIHGPLFRLFIQSWICSKAGHKKSELFMTHREAVFKNIQRHGQSLWEAVG